MNMKRFLYIYTLHWYLQISRKNMHIYDLFKLIDENKYLLGLIIQKYLK